MTNPRTLVLRRRHGLEKQRLQRNPKKLVPPIQKPVDSLGIAQLLEPRASWIVRLFRRLFGWIGGAE